MRIRSCTTDYDMNEDRIRLAVAFDDGSTRVLWLTRRLAERLVPPLIEGLAPPPAQQADEQRALEAAQIYAQLEARVNRKPSAPVKVDPTAPSGLVREITLKSGRDGVRGLLLRCPPDEPAELMMRSAEMRQWLEMLFRAFVKGGWREDIWPVWMRQRRPKRA